MRYICIDCGQQGPCLQHEHIKGPDRGAVCIICKRLRAKYEELSKREW